VITGNSQSENIFEADANFSAMQGTFVVLMIFSVSGGLP
jgi:hypothetical protein